MLLNFYLSCEHSLLKKGKRQEARVNQLLLLFPIPDSRFPIPDSPFPIPDSRFPIPDSLFPIPDSLFP
ncbi:MAG: hypothetical protein F6K59_26355, partial [Moorea sp. SIO3F7]|nr:hypothetical protein [Moorena sp. SIO3F7]